MTKQIVISFMKNRKQLQSETPSLCRVNKNKSLFVCKTFIQSKTFIAKLVHSVLSNNSGKNKNKTELSTYPNCLIIDI